MKGYDVVIRVAVRAESKEDAIAKVDRAVASVCYYSDIEQVIRNHDEEDD
jgi:hypothetical protein